jgi:hypothetical protein
MTIFSAPNYCYRCNNMAAVMQIDEHGNKNLIQFEHAARRGRLDMTSLKIDKFIN